MSDYILREESDRFHANIQSSDRPRTLGCFASEEEAREAWAKAQMALNGVNISPLAVDLWQSRACSGDPPFILKKGIISN